MNPMAEVLDGNAQRDAILLVRIPALAGASCAAAVEATPWG